jgi:hypothetical protein
MSHVKMAGLGMAAGLAAVLTCAVPSYAGAQGSGKDAHRTETLSLVIRQTQTTNVDVGAPGPSQGDELVFTGNLLRNGAVVGHDNGVCTLTQVGPNSTGDQQCLITLSLARGSITAHGRVGQSSAAAFDLAVTGGTGDFITATGFIRGGASTGNDTPIAVYLLH